MVNVRKISSLTINIIIIIQYDECLPYIKYHDYLILIIDHLIHVNTWESQPAI